MGLIGTAIGIGVGGKAVPNPSGVSGIQNWWTAEAGTTIATGVSQWASQSGLATVLAQATGANQPTVSNTGAPNSRKCLTFNGSSQFMTVASAGGLTTSPWTIGIVLNGTATLGHAFSVGDSAANNGMAVLIGNNRDVSYPSVATLQDSAYALGIWEYWLITNDGSTTTFYLSNVSKALTNSASQPAAPTAHTSVGADPAGTNIFTGSVAQIFTYNRVVSAGDRANLESWVNLLYGL